MTVLARDEADILDAQIAFHLHAGVDFVIATDNRSSDGTTEILERYEREGSLRLIREDGVEVRQSEWVTHMARLAASEHQADWVVNTDADEFWWPREGSLKDVLAAVPHRFGVVRGAWRHFLPRPDDGGFFDTGADAEALVARPRDPSDNAAPSGLSSMVHALVDAHALTGEGRYLAAAEEALATVAELAERAPRFAGWSLAAAQTLTSGGPLEVAVVGPASDARAALAALARRHPGAVVIESEGPLDDVPLLSGRTPVDGLPAAYVCRGFVCERPVTSVEELSGLLR